MMGFNDRFRDRPFPELLAAYVDGELDAAGRAQVETWLAAHPDAYAEVENQRKLSRKNGKLWHFSAPPSPGERSWTRLFQRMHTALTNRPVPAPQPVHRGLRVRHIAAVAAI